MTKHWKYKLKYQYGIALVIMLQKQYTVRTNKDKELSYTGN